MHSILIISSQNIIVINMCCKSMWTSREFSLSSCFEMKGMAQQREIQSTVYTLSVAMSVITEPRCGLKLYLRNSHPLEMEIFHSLVLWEGRQYQSRMRSIWNKAYLSEKQTSPLVTPHSILYLIKMQWGNMKQELFNLFFNHIFKIHQ